MKEKIERIQRILKQHEIDGWLVFSHHSYDIHSKYLLEKNITSATMILVQQTGSPIVISSRMEAMMIDDNVYEIKPYSKSSELLEIMKDTLTALPSDAKIAMNFVEKEEALQNLTYDIIASGSLSYIKEMNPKIKFVSAKNLIFDIRSVKTQAEIENHKIAAKLAEELMEESVEPQIKAGMTEKELKALIEYECNKRGGIAFEAIVASGEHSAIPHHHAVDKKIQNDQVLLIDYGVAYNWSNSDITHTYYIGSKPPEKVLRVYEAIHESKEAAYKLIKAGTLSSEVEEAVRQTMKEFGFDPEKHYIHSTGHPLGIETHDIGTGIYMSTEKRPPKPLLENSVITVEPGLYFEGEFGVRLEDDCVVTKDGYMRLSQTPKELITL
ncbi:MAG: M24 family metallopeptidase [Candidatus Heimdallarchaeaceae archaeon]